MLSQNECDTNGKEFAIGKTVGGHAPDSDHDTDIPNEVCSKVKLYA